MKLTTELNEETTAMAKTGLQMSEAEVNEFIRKCKDEERLTWGQIANRLGKMGYKSRRNGKPLSVMTVRFRYYNPGRVEERKVAQWGGSAHPIRTSAEGSDRALELIRSVMKMKTDADGKIAFIEEILKQYS